MDDLYEVREVNEKYHLFKNGEQQRIATAPEISLAFRAVDKDANKEIRGSEALFGFLGLCSNLDEPFNVGKDSNEAQIAAVVQNFCERNQLEPPRLEWLRKLI